MAKEFKFPELGENIDSIQVVQVMVSPGGSVEEEQPVLELETDKATIEVPSTVSGTVAAVHVNPGDAIQTGQLIFSLAEGGEQEKSEPAAEKTEKPAADSATTSESVEETTEAPAEPAETPSEKPAPAKATVAVTKEVEPPPASKGGKKVPAAPSVRRFAREIGIDLTQVPGSGPQGRVSKEDVKAYSRRLNTERSVGAVPGIAEVPELPDFEKWGAVERKKMSVIRSKTAEHMSLSWSQVPHVTIYDKADISELEVLRKKYAPLAEKEGGKLTMAVMVCKIVAHALRKFPVFNASADMSTREIIYKDYVHLGIAVNTKRGLMVPAIRDADRKNMVTLASEIQEIAAKCRDGKIKLEEIEGSTFTVTNLGRVCGEYFTPIVNYPEVGILGIGRAAEEARVVDGAVVPRTMLPLSLSFDHRVIDGADGARFLGWIRSAIEEPLVLALDG
jgi:pyruvate dehydrogenase E2 component (dihydrolipoamide acetyltransferase)